MEPGFRLSQTTVMVGLATIYTRPGGLTTNAIHVSPQSLVQCLQPKGDMWVPLRVAILNHCVQCSDATLSRLVFFGLTQILEW